MEISDLRLVAPSTQRPPTADRGATRVDDTYFFLCNMSRYGCGGKTDSTFVMVTQDVVFPGPYQEARQG
jgi:hypothetical protein